MTPYALAQQSYAAPSASIRTERDTEYAVFAKVTNQLKAAMDSDRFDQMAAAIHTNRQLWSILAIDVADKENGLPKQLRAQIVYLYEFTNSHSQKILRREEGASIEPLLEINRSIMRGLRGVKATAT